VIDRDAYLLHQIHAAKLATDVLSGIASTSLMWRRRLGVAVLVGFIPSALASAAVVRTDLSRLRRTRRGRYVLAHMPPGAQAVRLLGQGIMWRAASRHSCSGVVSGLILVVLGWSHGLLPGER
jgi:hypothetical protein